MNLYFVKIQNLYFHEKLYFLKTPTEGLVTCIELAADERAARETRRFSKILLFIYLI